MSLRHPNLPMDTTLCREHLGELLTEEATALTRLESLLEQEHGFIVGDNIESLDSTGAARQECVGTLMRIEDERHALCRAVGMSGDRVGLKKLLAWCDPENALQARWTESTRRIRHCRALNDRNGALVNGRLKRVEGLLSMLNARAAESRTYTARGSAYQQTAAGRVLNAQV